MTVLSAARPPRSGWRGRARSAYLGGVWLKGIHGGLDVMTATIVLIAPQLLPTGLLWSAEETGDLLGAPGAGISGALRSAGADLLSWPAWLLGAFLLVHGAVKLASAFCLLRRMTRGYPWAIAALCALLVYQVWDAAATGSITMTALALLDAVIIGIVVTEYRHLRAAPGRAPEPRKRGCGSVSGGSARLRSAPDMTTARSRANAATAGHLLNKVPEVTVFFWLIKVLCTTVGETVADFLNTNLNWGLSGTTAFMGALLAIVLVVQFRSKQYRAPVYWLAVVLLSVVGTLITDNLTDDFGVPLVTTTVLFSVALGVVFAVWFAVERTLSIHSITTTRREAFYWLAILFTFALGTSAGDLAAEKLALGYLPSALIFAGAIAVVFVAHRALRLNAIAAFWLAYILTRPLGASLGDSLSQARADGGLGLGTTTTSALFLTAILALVSYLALTGHDRSSRGERYSAIAAD